MSIDLNKDRFLSAIDISSESSDRPIKREYIYNHDHLVKFLYMGKDHGFITKDSIITLNYGPKNNNDIWCKYIHGIYMDSVEEMIEEVFFTIKQLNLIFQEQVKSVENKPKYLDVITVESESYVKYENEIYNNNDIFEFINKIFSEKKLSRLLIKCFYNDDFGDDNAGCFFEYIEPAGPQDVDSKPKYLANYIFKTMEDKNIFFKENPDEDVHPAWTTEKIREFMKEGIPFDPNVKINFNPYTDPPNHYKFGDMEVIDMIRETLSIEQFKGFCMGNIIKYRMRAGKKEGSDDIAKAFKYEEYMEEEK